VTSLNPSASIANQPCVDEGENLLKRGRDEHLDFSHYQIHPVVPVSIDAQAVPFSQVQQGKKVCHEQFWSNPATFHSNTGLWNHDHVFGGNQPYVNTGETPNYPHNHLGNKQVDLSASSTSIPESCLSADVKSQLKHVATWKELFNSLPDLVPHDDGNDKFLSQQLKEAFIDQFAPLHQPMNEDDEFGNYLVYLHDDGHLMPNTHGWYY
jgi:hypothetical protein